MINVSSKDSDYSVTSELPKPYRDGFTEEQMATLREYARTVLQQEREHTVDTAVLFGDDLDASMLELAKLAYRLAVHHDVPYVNAWAQNKDIDSADRGGAYARNRDGEWSDTMAYDPEET